MKLLFVKQAFIIFFLFNSAYLYAVSFKSVKDVPYAANSVSHEQQLDIYLPKNSTKCNLPVHVYVHGGAWTMGDKSLNIKEIKSYTDKGVILVSINYRLGSKYKFPTNIQDVEEAVKWVIKNITNYNGDPTNIVISGHSAGAHLIALAGTRASLKSTSITGDNIKAIIPIDTASYDLTKTSNAKVGIVIRRQQNKVFGRNKETLRLASPIYQIQINETKIPFTLFVSQKRSDAVQETLRFSKALKNHKHDVKTIIMNEELSHSDMRKLIFKPNSLINNKILASFTAFKPCEKN